MKASWLLRPLQNWVAAGASRRSAAKPQTKRSAGLRPAAAPNWGPVPRLSKPASFPAALRSDSDAARGQPGVWQCEAPQETRGFAFGVKRLKAAVLVGALAACLPWVSRADTVTLNPVEDTWAWSIFPNDAVFGAYTILDLIQSGQTGTAWTYLRFDLSEPNNLPPGAVISSAELQLFLSSFSGQGAWNIPLYSVNQAWSESTLTWSNRPGTNSLVATATVPATNDWVTWKITSLVQDWWSGARTNLGMVLLPWVTNEINLSFPSREDAGNPPKPPRLVITFQRPLALSCSNLLVNCGSVIPTNPPPASGGCSSNLNVTLLGSSTNGSGCAFTITRVWLATDSCNSSTVCTQTVSVVDLVPPVITCATNKSVECGSSWNFDQPSAFDTCCGTNLTMTVFNTLTNGTGCELAITRTWRATDCCTNSAVCSQTVTVWDTQPPVITCATNKSVECGSSWSFDQPAAFDTCCGTNLTMTVFNTLTNGTGCELAITRTWRATDCCSNSATCSQTVTVRDTIPPQIQCPTNVLVTCAPSNVAAVSFSPTASDVCALGSVVCQPPSGSFFPLGTNLVHCTATDLCGNSNTCDFTVTVLSNCVTPHLTFVPQPSDIRLRLNQLVYGFNSQISAELDLGAHRLGTNSTYLVLTSERAGDLEVVAMQRNSVEKFNTLVPLTVDFSSSVTRLDNKLQVQSGDTIWGFWVVSGLVSGPAVTEQVVAAFALAGGGNFSGSPQYVLPELALTADELVVPPGGKPISTLLVKNTSPVQFPVDELIVYPTSLAQLNEIVSLTGGSILASNTLPEDAQIGIAPNAYLVRVNSALGNPVELPLMRAFINSGEDLYASSEAGLRIVALALRLQLQGYPVGLNPRLQVQGVPHISDSETTGLPQSLTHPVFDWPRAWAFMAIMDRDTRRIPVAFLDQGFNPNRDFRRNDLGAIPECDFEGRTLLDLLSGLVCVPGRAESTPTTGASLVGDPVWHGNGVVSVAGGVLNNGYGVAGTGGQVVQPMLYRYGVTSYAFEIGLGIRKAVWDGASVINLSAGFPCRIVTWLGLDPNWCDPLGRAAFCLELPLHVARAAGVACEKAVDCDVPILCDIVESLAGAVCAIGGASLSLGTLTPACLATVPLGDLRNPLHSAISFAATSGVPVVSVAGNKLDPESFPPILRPLLDLSDQRVESWQIEPAMWPDTIVCGSAQSDFPFTNIDFYGPRVDVWAPIPSAYFAPDSTAALEPDDTRHTRQELYGTSAAAPYITGLIADMMALNPRLDPHNPALSPAQRAKIPALIQQLLRERAYTAEQLTDLAPAGDLRTATAAAGVTRRNLVNPTNTLRGAAFQILDGMTTPALPDFTALGYDPNLDFNESDPAIAADTLATARALSAGGAVLNGTIVAMRGEGGRPTFTDQDIFQFTAPTASGLWRAVFELTQPRDFETLRVQTSAGETLPGSRVSSTPTEVTTRHESAPYFASATSYVKLSGAGADDNPYKFRLLRFDLVSGSLLPDRFDANLATTPPESRPDNNIEARAGRLGRPGEFNWQRPARPTLALESRTIQVPHLNFHNPTDEDWFCVVPPADFATAGCGANLTIEAAAGVHIQVYLHGLTEVVAAGSTRVTLPASLLFGSELCIRLTLEDAARPAAYDLRLELTFLNSEICAAIERARLSGPVPGSYGFIGGSGHIPFPGSYPGLGAGPIPRCDPRVCDPAPSAGARSFDNVGRILNPDLYLIEWNTFDTFDGLVELLAGAALRVQLIDDHGAVLATSQAFSDLAPANLLPGQGGVLHLHKDWLLPGHYFLKFDQAFPGTLLNVVLSRGAVFDGGLAYEDVAPVTPRMQPPTFDDWARAAIPEGLDRSPTGDPDHDGRNNLREMLFGSNPTITNDAKPPTLQLSGKNLTGEFEIRFTHPTWLKNYDFHLEGAQALGLPWQPLPPGPITERPVGPGLSESVYHLLWPRNSGLFRPIAVPIPDTPPSSPGESLRVGFFNVQFLAEPFTDDSPCCDGVDDRATRIANRILRTGYDVIGVAEAFTEDIKSALENILRPYFHYYVRELDYAGLSIEQDSGLMLFSRFPFKELPARPDAFRGDVTAYVPRPFGGGWMEWGDVAFVQYDNFDVPGGLPFPDCYSIVDVNGTPQLVPLTKPCWGDDCWAAKGAGLVRIEHPVTHRIYNVVFTHTDAGDEPCDQHVRAFQLQLVDRMVREVLGTHVLTEPLIFMGDLNVRGEDTDRTTPGMQRNAEWLARFPDGQFTVHLGADGVSDPLPLSDLWEAQNQIAFGLADDCRDGGLTGGMQYTVNGRARYDYIFLNSGVVQDLSVQHFALAYALKDNVHPEETFQPAAFGEEGRQILSDHMGMIADINLTRPNCTPTTASEIAFQPALPAGPLLVESSINVNGGMKWYRLNQPGAFTFSLESRVDGMEYQVYATYDISRPLQPETPPVRAGGGVVVPPPQPGTGTRTTPFTYRAPIGCPLLVRVRNLNRSATGSFKLEVTRHLGLTKETAISLHANEPLFPIPVPTGLPGETYQRWFRVTTERANSGREQLS